MEVSTSKKDIAERKLANFMYEVDRLSKTYGIKWDVQFKTYWEVIRDAE